MRLTYAFPAEAAQYTPDGKLWLLGGDLDTFRAAAFPAFPPALALVIKLQIEPNELRLAHQLRVELHGSEGFTNQAPLIIPFAPRAAARHPDRPVKVGVTVQVQNLVFPRPGSYEFVIWVDNQELGRVQVDVESASPVPPDGT